VVNEMSHVNTKTRNVETQMNNEERLAACGSVAGLFGVDLNEQLFSNGFSIGRRFIGGELKRGGKSEFRKGFYGSRIRLDTAPNVIDQRASVDEVKAMLCDVHMQLLQNEDSKLRENSEAWVVLERERMVYMSDGKRVCKCDAVPNESMTYIQISIGRIDGIDAMRSAISAVDKTARQLQKLYEKGKAES